MYAIVENVDLGYHIVVGYNSHEKAICRCAELNEQARAEKIKGLIKLAYSFEDAVAYANRCIFFEVVEVDMAD